MARSFWNMFAPRTGRTASVHRRPTPSFRPCVMLLEDRSLPSVVTNLLDSGPGSLRNAVGLAVSGEIITFAVSGTITLTTGEIASSTPNLTITGPGAGDLAVSGGDAAHTNSSRIFDFGDSSIATISGLSLINGMAGPPTLFITDVVGGAILSTGTLTVNNCVFNNNIATDPTVVASGGAIWSSNHLTLNNDTFTNNSADDSGGAVAGLLDPGLTGSAALTANNCYFSNNGALNGGALAAFDNLTLTGDFFNANGGPLNPTTHLITRGNNGGNISAWNGGIAGITQTIDKTTLAGGVATYGGGLYYFNATDLSLTNSTVYGNDAFFGGGIYKSDQTNGLTIKSTTITANNAQFSGGGISNFDSTFVLKDSIVAGNTEGTPFYGLVPDDIMGNVVATTTVDGVVDTANTSDYNIIGHGRGLIAVNVTIVNGITTVTPVNLDGINHNHVGTEANPIDAGLSDLRNNGGRAVGANDAFNLKTVALLANSPAIGAADPALAGTTDQNGAVRSATPNVGAIEYVANTANHVIFMRQPTDTPAGQTISPVVVEVVDVFGNLVNNDNTDTVTLSIGTDPSGGTAMLSGTLTLTFANGVATFIDLSIDTAGTGYTLHATASGLTPDIDSILFNIT
jgi:predicted outer membrane repeat protein